MIGAIRLCGPVLLRTKFASVNGDRFVPWMRTLIRKLHPGDIVVMDNAKAQHDTRVRKILQEHQLTLIDQPPYSPDFNPIEPAWANTKRDIQAAASRRPDSLRKVASRAFWNIASTLCFRWFQHAGYQVPLN